MEQRMFHHGDECIHCCIMVFLVILIVKSKSVPGFGDEAFGAVFSVLAYLVVFQYTGGLVDAAFTTDVFWV